MLLKSLLNQNQYSMIMDTRRTDHLKRTARAGRDKVIGRKTGEKPIPRKEFLHCLLSTLPGIIVTLGMFLKTMPMLIKNIMFCCSGEVRSVKGIPRSLSVGQVIWAPSSCSLVFVAWSSDNGFQEAPRKLGIKYCYNRPCALYAAPDPFREESEKLSTLWVC